jgi:hypothetical protein
VHNQSILSKWLLDVKSKTCFVSKRLRICHDEKMAMDVRSQEGTRDEYIPENVTVSKGIGSAQRPVIMSVDPLYNAYRCFHTTSNFPWLTQTTFTCTHNG